MNTQTDVALKEWSILCKALADGRQALLIRKGGIHDKRKEFEMDHHEFFLFPTYYHAKPEDVIPEARADLEALTKKAPPDSEVHVALFCKVEDAIFIEDRRKFDALKGMHIYSDSQLDVKYNYRKPGLWVLTVRAYKLPKETVLPNTEEYAGCVTWVTLDKTLSAGGAVPALSDEEFERRRKAIKAALA